MSQQSIPKEGKAAIIEKKGPSSRPLEPVAESSLDAHRRSHRRQDRPRQTAKRSQAGRSARPPQVLRRVRFRPLLSGVITAHELSRCHTDLHALLGDWPIPVKANCVGGHEGAGEVRLSCLFPAQSEPTSASADFIQIVAIGEHTQTDLKVGDRVGIKCALLPLTANEARSRPRTGIADSCNRCQFCRQGYEPLCQSAQCSGYTVDGSFAQYAVSYTSQLSLIPDNLPFEDAAPILCAGVTVYKALKEANVKAGEWIVVAGSSGGLGHLAVQVRCHTFRQDRAIVGPRP